MKRHFILSLALAVAVSLGLCTFLNAQEVRPAKVLHFTRSQGFEHDPARRLDDGTTVSGRALARYFAGMNKNIEVVETQDGTIFDGDLSQFDAFVFYTSGNLLNPEGSKNNYARAMTEAGLRNMFAAVRAGKGFVGIHAATDTHSNIRDENGVDLYTRFVGARFTGHGPDQFGTLTIVQPTAFPFLQESGKRITTWDEWYGMGYFADDLHVLLIQETVGADGTRMDGRDYDRPPFPMTWIRQEGEGRVAYTSFGHSNWYFQNTENVRRIAELVEWAVGRFDADTTPNIEQVTPSFRTMPGR